MKQKRIDDCKDCTMKQKRIDELESSLLSKDLDLQDARQKLKDFKDSLKYGRACSVIGDEVNNA